MNTKIDEQAERELFLEWRKENRYPNFTNDIWLAAVRSYASRHALTQADGNLRARFEFWVKRQTAWSVDRLESDANQYIDHATNGAWLAVQALTQAEAGGAVPAAETQGESVNFGRDVIEVYACVVCLRKQAAEIAAAGHPGWGNTMTWAADIIEGIPGQFPQAKVDEPVRGLSIDNSKQGIDWSSTVTSRSNEPVRGVPGGWVVSNADISKFRTFDGFNHGWTTDVNSAMQFARRVDAELWCREDEDAWSIQPLSRFAPSTKKARKPSHTNVPDALTYLTAKGQAANDDWMMGWNDCRLTMLKEDAP